MFSKPFRLVGDRSYVQGSQMLARAAEMLSEATGERASLRDCGFHHLAAADVEVDLIADDPATAGYFGHASFACPGGSHTFGFRSTDTPVQRTEDQADWGLQPSVAPSGLSGEFAFDGVTDFESLLEVVIAGVKTMHSGLAQDVTDIWFTGCRKSDLPVYPPGRSGRLLVRPIRIMGRNGRFQTLCSAELQFPDEVRRAILSFAFKSRGFRHVD
jgi:hypothetical protein